MAKGSSGFVVVLTAAAIATVGFLAYQAQANVPASLAEPRADHSGAHGAKPSRAPRPKKDPKDLLPSGSGVGKRVVYSLAMDRVWLISASGGVERTYTVTPSTVDPTVGEFTVTSRSASTTGSDGVPIEHVVRFAAVDGVTIGFSATVDGSEPAPDPAKKTGGIRETRPDGDALWDFADVGAKVVVVP